MIKILMIIFVVFLWAICFPLNALGGVALTLLGIAQVNRQGAVAADV